MHDVSVLLLLLILLNMLLDYAFSSWRARTVADAGQTLLMALLQGVGVGALVYGFDRHVLVALAASAGFAVGWGLIRWVMDSLTSVYRFIWQFALQVALLLVIWLSVEGYWGWLADAGKDQFTPHNLLVLLAYLLVWRPASALTGAVLTPFMPGVKESSKDSLKKAGSWIGYLERSLILTFVLLEQWEAIGFLLTAKSILRFNDIKGSEQRSLSEYVLLGTLVSFSVSIAIGLAVLKLGGK
ncbi:hypothetical protein ACIPL1_08000 [Pseudomonas sp. NPDC090202]|uniref:hypothetical protein n=1 Tax=unclassified Pseudomonas TaxID=196821 RepID=UPI00381E02FF